MESKLILETCMWLFQIAWLLRVVLSFNVSNTIVYSYQKDIDYVTLSLRDAVDIHFLTR